MTESELRNRWQSMTGAGPAVSLQYVRHRMSALESQARRRNIAEYLGALMGYAILVWAFFSIEGAMLRTALVVIGVGATYSLFRWYRVANVRKLDEPAGIGDGLAAYRSELERQHAARHNNWRWYIAPSLPGTVLLLIGSFLISPQRIGALVLAASFASAWIGSIMWMNARSATRLQREIDALDSLRS